MPSCTPVPEVTVKVPCQGTTHRLSWTGRKLRFHDHDAAGLRFLAALEVPCGCASIADRLPQGDLDIPEPLRAAYAKARGAVEARFRVTTQPLTATLVLRGFQPRIEATIQPITGRVIGALDIWGSMIWLPVALHRSGRWHINWQCLRRSAQQIGVDQRKDGTGRDPRHNCPICRTHFRLGTTLVTIRDRHFNSTGHRDHVVAWCADAFTATGVPMNSPLPREIQCLPATQ
jgi:hypothetical protein